MLHIFVHFKNTVFFFFLFNTFMLDCFIHFYSFIFLRITVCICVLIQAKLVETGECNNCTLWNFISCLTWGNEFFESGASVDLITSGSWQPQYGLKLYDNVFPHSVHGFRGKTLPIISFHVSVIFIENLLQYINISL